MRLNVPGWKTFPVSAQSVRQMTRPKSGDRILVVRPHWIRLILSGLKYLSFFLCVCVFWSQCLIRAAGEKTQPNIRFWVKMRLILVDLKPRLYFLFCVFLGPRSSLAPQAKILTPPEIRCWEKISVESVVCVCVCVFGLKSSS